MADVGRVKTHPLTVEEVGRVAMWAFRVWLFGSVAILAVSPSDVGRVANLAVIPSEFMRVAMWAFRVAEFGRVATVDARA